MAAGDKLPVVMGKEKAVPNGVATLGADGKLDEAQRPTTDATPTEDSTNPVQSGGVYTALAGKADLTLSNLSNRQKALRNIGGRPNRNLLDNWYFVGGGSQQGGGQFPINQRGELTYTNDTGTWKYCIDRWIHRRSVVTITADGISLAESVNQNAFIFEQILEASHVPAGVLTATFLLAGNNLLTVTDEYKKTGADEAHAKNFEIGGYNYQVIFGAASDTNFNPYVNIKSTSSDAPAVNIIAAKLELGDHQTLAYQDEEDNWQLFETPDYGEELAKCQRYLIPTQGELPMVGRTFVASETMVIAFLPTPIAMRTNPTWTGEASNLIVYANGKRFTPTAISSVTSLANGIRFNLTIPTGAGTNQNVTVSFADITNAFFSAEL